jgi:small nuclear ribonucleoprotein (snRNP)-like protein
MPPVPNTTEKKKDGKKSTSKPRRRTPHNEQSLLCYVQSLVNVPLVIVELRDDSVVRGTVVECDDCMHVTLKRCERVTIDREIREYEHLFIKNRTIRGIHVPKRYETCELIEKRREEQFQARTFYQRQVVQGTNVGKGRLGKGTDGDVERSSINESEVLDE